MVTEQSTDQTMYVIVRRYQDHPKSLNWATPVDFEGDDRDVTFPQALKALAESVEDFDADWTAQLVSVPRAENPSWDDANRAVVLAEARGGA